jgi:hypothetical protein
MKHFKKYIKLLALVFFMVLMSIGVGLNGGIPVATNRKRERDHEIKIELVEEKDDDENQGTIKEIKP